MHALLFVAAFLVPFNSPVGLPQGGQDSAVDDIDKAISELYSDKHAESDFAKQELVEIGRRSVPKVLAELGKQRETDKTKQVRVRRLLCEVLGRIRDNSQPVLDALIARLTDADEYGMSVAAAAAGALDTIADDRASGALVTALTSKQAEGDKWLKYYCIHALGVLRASNAAEAVRKALEDTGAAQVAGEDTHLIASAAADALGRIRAKDAVDALGKLLSNDKRNPYTEQSVGVHAARALERITGESKGSLAGEQQAIDASLKLWREWWTAEAGKKNAATTRTLIGEVASAVEAYKKDHGKLPVTLAYLREKPASGLTAPYPDGGYYKGDRYAKGEIKDAWDRPLKYDTMGANGALYDIVSYGGDGRVWGKGDGADLWNHDSWKGIRLEKSKKALAEVAAAMAKCKEEQGRYTDRPEGLVGPKPPPGFTPQKEWPKDGYLKEVPKDGFESAFVFKSPGTGGEAFDLLSFGADTAPGGIDENADLWNHDKWKLPRVDDTRKKMETLKSALELFKKEQDRYPAQLADLASKPSYAKKDKWPVDGYDKDPVNDAFGNALVWRPAKDGVSWELGSLGADGREGGTGPDEDLWVKSK